MENKMDYKKDIAYKIENLLNNEALLRLFSFFFDKLEGIRGSYGEVRKALEIFIKSTPEKVMIEKGEKVVFLDMMKIEVIYYAVKNKKGVRMAITIDIFKQKYQTNILREDKWGERYREFLSLYQDGDVIYETVSSFGTWKALCGSAFVALYRNGESIAVIQKSMS